MHKFLVSCWDARSGEVLLGLGGRGGDGCGVVSVGG